MSDDQGIASDPPERLTRGCFVPELLADGSSWSRIARGSPRPFSNSPGSRFSAPELSSGFLYCGDTLETCFWEVFWDSLSSRDRYLCLPVAHLAERHVHVVKFKRALKIFDATNPAQLKAVGASGVACFNGPYAPSRRWAERLHSCEPLLDGILYPSARTGAGRNLALFGDRVGVRDLSISKQGVSLDKVPEIIDLLIREKVGLL